MNASQTNEKRQKPSKPRALHERRAEMRLLHSATQHDIYIWAASVAFMGAVVGAIVIASLLGVGQ